MSRVSYAMLHEGGAVEMTRASARRSRAWSRPRLAVPRRRSRTILEITIVGNPIMHHLLLGIDPIPLGSAPFALATDARRSARPRASWSCRPTRARGYTSCRASPGTSARTRPASILAETPYLADEVTLLVDVGTNAEIVLGNRERLLAASSPTGPAFEGAQISGGQRAAPGAIERVRIDRDTLEPRFRVIGSSRWSDETGFAASTRRTGVTGICGSGIVEVIAELFLAGVITADGTIDGRLAARSPRIVPDGRTFAYLLTRAGRRRPRRRRGRPRRRAPITQNDVRAIQLAKAALYAGARLLMDHLGVETVDRVKLAGAFGSQIDPLHALVLGLVPGRAAGPRRRGRQRRGHGCADRAALRRGAARDRAGRADGREDRDRGRAAVPGALRRRDGVPARPAPYPNLANGSSTCRRRSARTPLQPSRRRPRAAGRAERRRRSSTPTARRRRRDDRRRRPRRRAGGGRAAGRPHRAALPRRARAVPDPRSSRTRSSTRRACRSSRRTPTRSSRRSGSIFRGDPAALEMLQGRRRRRRRRARPVPARHVPPDRPGDGAADVHAARPEPRADRPDRRPVHGPRARTTARRSCATSTTAAATGRSRTSGTS